ncbi:anti-sigma B factor antagonist [Saccharothrix variisporea]|uniref:Anti-sigma factor antagonist n=1 Tax=Saccharothrix variisporea TaxID=543527 RepID=A0A495XP37_9PSEU|nr:anti-sigma B factor antagonist [Saccharothrix variisporea]
MEEKRQGASITVARRRRVVFAAVRGEIDTATCDQVRRDLLACLADAPEGLVVDLAGVTFLGSLGIAVLVEVREHAERAGVAFAVVADRAAVVRPMYVTEVDGLLGLCSSVEEAVEAVRGGARHGFSWWSS